jgi:hypothetical protein
LLPGHDRNGAIAEAIQIPRGCVVCAEGPILLPQDFDHRGADGILDPNFPRGFFNSILIGRMAIKLTDAGKIEKERGVEPRGSGQLGR